MDLNGIGALVTGGASGLGEATTRELAAPRARVTIPDLNEERGQALAAELGGRFAQADVTDEASGGRDGRGRGGRRARRFAVDCAGIGWAQRTVGQDGRRTTSEPFETVVARQPDRHLQRAPAGGRGDGRRPSPARTASAACVVNTASIAAYDGQIGQIAYAASKGGIVGMTLPAARDLSSARHPRLHDRARAVRHAAARPRCPRRRARRSAADDTLPEAAGPARRLRRAGLRTSPRTATLNGEVIRLDGALRMAPR